MRKKNLILFLMTLEVLFSSTAKLYAQEDMPFFLKDRGTGISTSMFGTYINKGEMIIYPFFEFYHDRNAEYKPEELGYSLDRDFRGRHRAIEGLLFFGYGITDRLAVEFETAVISATQYKSKEDPSAMPEKIKESGLGDVEGQLRYRWLNEAMGRPELFSYFETVFPLQKNRKLIGTQNWEFKLGSGMTKGFKWGTMTMRLAVEMDTGENKVEMGEFAIEYLKRISDLFRFYIGLEGAQDEMEFITDLQFHILPYAFIRLNNAFGVTSKATDYAPEIGVLFHF